MLVLSLSAENVLLRWLINSRNLKSKNVEQVFIGLGSNIDAELHIKKGMELLTDYFPDCKFSPLYESESVGFEGDNFINLVAEFSSELAIDEISNILGKIEDASGRTRAGSKFSARTLDLDLLLYGDVILTKPIVLPRGEITENAFVLLPLSKLAPDLKHPVLDQTYAELWQEYPQKKQNLWKL